MFGDDQDFSGFLPSGALKEYREEVAEYQALTDGETRILFQKAAIAKNEQEKKILRGQIAKAYLSFVIDIAESFTEIELILVDYIQEGNIALLLAIDEYDYHGQESFLEFCLPRIQKAIVAYMAENPVPVEPIQIVPKVEDEENPSEEEAE